MGLLNTIESPDDLRKLPKRQLAELTSEIREMMLDSVSRCGGHLAPSLGVVELTIALHYCYKTPEDKVIWDVGHQCYAHKILTGRMAKINTLRQFGSISGFPRVLESEYDALSTGHASTSISAGLGMALARDLKGERFNVVVVIGDGSLTGGLAFEGLNNLGTQQTNMTVILNDNEMSISPNVGALSKYLTRIITDKRFERLRTDVWDLLGAMPHIGKRIRSMVSNVDDIVKRLVIPGKLFEDLGLRYLGPVDGHNLNELIDILTYSRTSSAVPTLIHVITKKGKGYSFAESNATKFHGIGTFSKETGKVSNSSRVGISYSEIFGRTLVELADKNKSIVAITAAMPDGTGLNHFRDRFPKRFFDVGIAEGHAVTFAAGLALQGIIPVVCLYSTFVQRAFDNIIHDVALDNLKVIFGIDRAGLVGQDGPTHHGAFDISFLRMIPGVTIMAPSNEHELRNMLHTAIWECKGPVCIRFPRENGSMESLEGSMESLPLYKPEIIRQGSKIAIVSVGHFLGVAQGVCSLLEEKRYKPTLVNARFVKPLDKEFYDSLFKEHAFIVTLEHNTVSGGFGSGLMELAAESNRHPRFLTIGYPDSFVVHGDINSLMESLGLTPAVLADRIIEFVKK